MMKHVHDHMIVVDSQATPSGENKDLWEASIYGPRDEVIDYKDNFLNPNAAFDWAMERLAAR